MMMENELTVKEQTQQLPKIQLNGEYCRATKMGHLIEPCTHFGNGFCNINSCFYETIESQKCNSNESDNLDNVLQAESNTCNLEQSLEQEFKHEYPSLLQNVVQKKLNTCDLEQNSEQEFKHEYPSLLQNNVLQAESNICDLEPENSYKRKPDYKTYETLDSDDICVFERKIYENKRICTRMKTSFDISNAKERKENSCIRHELSKDFNGQLRLVKRITKH